MLDPSLTQTKVASMKVTRSVKATGSSKESSPVKTREIDVGAVTDTIPKQNGPTTTSGSTEKQAESSSPEEPPESIAESKPATDENLNASNATIKKSPPRRDPSKPSSNFTPIERTFILMAISAVRADPKWRRHDESESIKDFTVPFCNAVRQKLIEDPDFRGKVAVAAATPDRKGKCKSSPSKESIRKIWTNLYLKGSITRDYTNMGRKRDTAAEERVKQYLQQNPDCKMSSRAIAAQTNTSNRNVIRILRQENLAVQKTKFKRPSEESATKRCRKQPGKKRKKRVANDC